MIKPRFLVLALAAIVIASPLTAQEADESTQVKKSNSGICHCPGGTYYDRTSNFTAFPTIEACIESGGRHPKQGQGDCPTKEAAQDSGG